MEFLITYSKEEKDIMEIAVYSYLNYYRARLESASDTEQREAILTKIKIAEKMLDEMKDK